MRQKQKQKCQIFTEPAPWRAEHDRVLAAYPIPSFVLNGNLTHDEWRVRFNNPEHRRRTDATIYFNSPIAPNLSMGDPLLANDLLSAKLLLLHAVATGRVSNALVASIFVRNYIQFVRWRVGVGVYRNHQLTPNLIELFLGRLSQFGILGLPPLREYFDEAKAKILSGEVELPKRQKGKRFYFGSTEFITSLGLANRTSLPHFLRREIDALVKDLGHRSTYRPSAVDDPIPTQIRVAAFLKPIELLYVFTQHLQHDPIGFAPFGANLVSQVARSVSRRTPNRTQTVPAHQVCHIVDKALIWVTEYASYLIAILDDVRRRIPEEIGRDRPHSRAIKAALRDCKPPFEHTAQHSPWPLHPSYFPSPNQASSPSVRTAVYDLLRAACLIVIVAFSARRIEEVNSLRDDCLVERDGMHFIRSLIEKSSTTMEEIPVPPVVHTALKVLEDLSATRRKRTGEPWLFAFDDAIPVRLGTELADSDEVFRSGRVDFYRILDEFAKFVGVPPLDDGSPWSPKPHQFRRWFGIVYHYRYAHPDLLALTYHYRHVDPDVTRRYITENVFGSKLRDRELSRAYFRRLADLDDAGRQFKYERFYNVVTGREIMSGPGGGVLARQLAKAVEDVASRLEVGPSGLDRQTILDAISPIVDETNFEASGHGFNYCKCGPRQEDLAQAVCLQVRARYTDIPSVSADPAYATPRNCSHCPHGVGLTENGVHLDKKIDDQRMRVCTEPDQDIREFERQRLEQLITDATIIMGRPTAERIDNA